MNKGFKYVVHSGIVRSKYDFQNHFITASQVMRLYNVDPKDCIVFAEGSTNKTGRRMNDGRNAIHLYPRSDGNYILPKREKSHESGT